MALIETFNIEPGINVELWKPEESSEELLTLLQNPHLYKKIIESYPTEKRRIEKLTTILLLKKIIGTEPEIIYKKNDRPYLAGRNEDISISHTQNCIAVALSSERTIGVDVEKISPKVLRIQDKFLSQSEKSAINEEKEIIHTLILWSAKESLYKALNYEGVDFKEHLHILNFKPEDSGFIEAYESRTHKNEKFRIYYRVYPEFVLTLCY